MDSIRDADGNLSKILALGESSVWSLAHFPVSEAAAVDGPGGGGGPGSVHVPHDDLAPTVLEEDVGVAVAVHVCNADHLPVPEAAGVDGPGGGGGPGSVHVPHDDLAPTVLEEDVGVA